MNNGITTVIDLTPGKIELTAEDVNPSLVHRKDIARAGNALLMAINGGPEAAGVVMLARAMGCELRQVRQ